jgi:ATP-dependent exoDNAse (exonuclease V) beta subunit
MRCWPRLCGQMYKIWGGPHDGHLPIQCTKHSRAGPAVMAGDDEGLPLQERIEAVADQAELEDVYNTERQLLYVVCTRARDQLLVTGVEPASEFLDDLTAPR